MMRAGADAEVCLTVTILDGLVMARSAMHHSANYRSVMVMGRARPITDPAQKAAKMRAFLEILSPGRWDFLRPMTEAELHATAVLSLSLDEASAKIRSGPPIDDEADLDTPVWAGVLPLRLTAGTPQPDDHCRPDVAPLDPTTGPSWG
jgi:nitroimidazol reductase NimA-like FMN-containing flavoprotein (pyridoxamine 5'-phosphate oxidase superfamily)